MHARWLLLLLLVLSGCEHGPYGGGPSGGSSQTQDASSKGKDAAVEAMDASMPDLDADLERDE